MWSVIGWLVAIALAVVVGIEAESWSWETRLTLALVVGGVPYLMGLDGR